MASACGRAGCFAHKTHAVDRCGITADTFYGSVYVFGNFIHAADDDDVFGAKADGSNTVACAVDVDHDTIFGNSICAGQVVVHQQAFPMQFSNFSGVFAQIAVDDFVIAFMEGFCQTHFTNGCGTTPGYGAFFGDQRYRFFQRFCRCGTVICFKVTFFQIFNQCFA